VEPKEQMQLNAFKELLGLQEQVELHEPEELKDAASTKGTIGAE
jgi:hypothetical protein